MSYPTELLAKKIEEHLNEIVTRNANQANRIRRLRQAPDGKLWHANAMTLAAEKDEMREELQTLRDLVINQRSELLRTYKERDKAETKNDRYNRVLHDLLEDIRLKKQTSQSGAWREAIQLVRGNRR